MTICTIKYIEIWGILFMLMCLGACPDLLAGQPDANEPEDFFEMSLEELMSIEIYDVSPLDIHHHTKGEFMLGYSASFMKMKGNRDGTSHVSTSEILSDFMVAPTKMIMNMQMFEAMYAPTDKMTIMTMIPYVNKSMDHVNRMGIKFKTKSEGIGDLRASALYSIYETKRHEVYISGGLSFPTGSISKRGDTPSGRPRLPYPMQLGSGTYDLLPAIVYWGINEPWAWGAHLGGTVRLGRNKHHYRLGDEFNGTLWLTRQLSDQLSAYLRLDSMVWDDIHGADSTLSPTMVPTADPYRQGGKRTDIGLGINLLGSKGSGERHKLSVEYRIPLYQSLHGPQLETDGILAVTWQKTF
jgi:hypothetical protein